MTDGARMMPSACRETPLSPQDLLDKLIDLENENEEELDIIQQNGLKALIKTLDTTLQDTLQSLSDVTGRGSHSSDEAALLQQRCRLVSLSQETPRDERVSIDVRVVFLKVGEIDTVNERFSADAFIQAKWREPLMDGQDRDAEFEIPDLASRENFWDPRLYVENALGEVKESVWYVTSFNSDGEATIYQRRRVKGTFFERMELNQFPFDTQDLTLTVTSDRGELELDLSPDESEISTVNVQSFVDEQEWNLHKHINTWKTVTTNVYKSSRHKHISVSISCTATRRAPFFLWNIILVMMFICTLIFTTFTVGQDLPQNRIQLSFILLLSNITFKFTVNQTLPKVSYLTYLDKYILISMAILCLVCVWHAVVSQLWVYVGQGFAKDADLVAFVALVIVYVLFNFIFFAYSKYMVSRRSKLYLEKDKRQRERLEKMEARSMKNSKTKVTPTTTNSTSETMTSV